MRIRFGNPFKKRKQFQEPVIIIRRYERMSFSPLTDGKLPGGGIKVIEERYTATRIIEMERQIEALKTNADKWDMIQSAIENEVMFVDTHNDSINGHQTLTKNDLEYLAKKLGKA